MISQDLFDAIADLMHILCDFMLNMPQEATPPELMVLDALKETCELVRKNNRCPEIAKAALDWETRFVSRMAKIQPEAQADAAEAA
jgi:hypothetical protein